MHFVTDRQTDRQTEDIIMPIADHTPVYYDRALMLLVGRQEGRLSSPKLAFEDPESTPGIIGQLCDLTY